MSNTTGTGRAETGELQGIAQVRHVCRTTIARDAWDRGQPLSVHGWIDGIGTSCSGT